ncbi:HAD-IIIA family hydrolase [bacterium]|nr:HAD-IIIA family hydrolase [bacterium]NUN44316.1 HAD-IIIA family hydrolase [bacterium]
MVDNAPLRGRIAPIKLLLTDVDGVLTDNGVYYTDQGEAAKRFSIRDGMGVDRLRKLRSVETGIITGETSVSVTHRAAKLGIVELHIGISDKYNTLLQILERRNLTWDEVAYIGDDFNDIEVLRAVGFSACPADAMPPVINVSHYWCRHNGGQGAFRELAELIIEYKP